MKVWTNVDTVGVPSSSVSPHTPLLRGAVEGKGPQRQPTPTGLIPEANGGLPTLPCAWGRTVCAPKELWAIPRVHKRQSAPNLPLPSAISGMIGWSRVLLSHTLDAARSY